MDGGRMKKREELKHGGRPMTLREIMEAEDPPKRPGRLARILGVILDLALDAIEQRRRPRHRGK